MAPAGLKERSGKMLTSAKNNITSYHYISIYKKTDILNWNAFFLLQTTYLHVSLKGLNSSLAQSDGELSPGEKCPSEWLLREQIFANFWFEP